MYAPGTRCSGSPLRAPLSTVPPCSAPSLVCLSDTVAAGTGEPWPFLLGLAFCPLAFPADAQGVRVFV